MNAPPFPTNPSVGEFFGNWVWNGVRWVCSPASGIRVNTVVFTTSGPYMPSPGLVTAVVEAFGGGGGGGDAFSTTGTALLSSGGGGSGGYSRSALAAALVLGGVQVTIGAGGVGGGGSGTTAGGNGGPTTFGALVMANGGFGGMNNNGGPLFGLGGSPAPPGTGDLAMPGGPGGQGMIMGGAVSTGFGGQGGQMWGGAANYVAGTGAVGDGADAWPNTGAGGSGAVLDNAIGGAQGGEGGSGLCVVTEYCFADSIPDDCLNPPVNVNARVAVTHVPWQGPGPCPPGWGQVSYESDD